MSNTTDTQAPEQLGTIPFLCNSCGNTHHVKVFGKDIRRGYLLAACPNANEAERIEGVYTSVVIPRTEGRPEPKGNVRANGLNSNYPDNWGGF